MSLNCLTCGQGLQRDNSEREENLPINKSLKKPQIQVDRSWSGNLSPPQNKNGAGSNLKTEQHRRTNSADNVGPKLLRSSGVRRDWSLEELIGKQDNGVSCC